jgi:hypothetical protein
MRPSLRKTHSYGNLHYNIIFMIHMYFVRKDEKKFKSTWTKNCHIFKFMVIVG